MEGGTLTNKQTNNPIPLRNKLRLGGWREEVRYEEKDIDLKVDLLVDEVRGGEPDEEQEERDVPCHGEALSAPGALPPTSHPANTGLPFIPQLNGSLTTFP